MGIWIVPHRNKTFGSKEGQCWSGGDHAILKQLAHMGYKITPQVFPTKTLEVELRDWWFVEITPEDLQTRTEGSDYWDSVRERGHWLDVDA